MSSLRTHFSTCSEEFFPYFPNHFGTVSAPTGLFALYNQWELTLKKLGRILEGNAPSIFISHAWHESYYRSKKGVSEQEIKEAIYYDYFDLILTRLLKEAGFEVFYDKDLSNSKGIMDEGAVPFMKSKVMSADIIISVCTPLYKERASMVGTGVHTEVECIKERIVNSPSISFFIPILVHASYPDFPVNNLLVGQEVEKMKQVIYLSLRDATTFISNIWRVLHRLWKNTKAKWEAVLDEDESALNVEKHLQQYVTILGELLQFEDYYDGDKHQSVASASKEVLKGDFYSLRLLTTLAEDIKPDIVLGLLKQEMSRHKELFTISAGQEIVAVLGNTGVGKSTMTNFLAGKVLKPDEYGQAYELVDEGDKSAFKIGKTMESETVYPQCVRIGKLLFFDLPGFMDSNGSIRDLINAAFIYQIMILAKSVRFVFLIGQDEITAQRGRILKRLISSIQNAFQSQEAILRSSMLIVTKSNFRFKDVELLIRFVHAKLSTNAGTSMKDQLEKWQQSQRINHIPHPSFEDISKQGRIRESLLQSMEKVIPMDNGELPQFNLSGFYPPEVSLPLLNMFGYLIREESLEFEMKDIREALSLIDSDPPKYVRNQDASLSEYVNALHSFEDRAKVYRGVVEDAKAKIQNYLTDEFWRSTVWRGFDRRLEEKKELKLLRDVSRDVYEQAKRAFEKEKQEEVKKHLPRVTTLLESLERSEQEWRSEKASFEPFEELYERFQSWGIFKSADDVKKQELNEPPYHGKLDLYFLSRLIDQENRDFVTNDIQQLTVGISSRDLPDLNLKSATSPDLFLQICNDLDTIASEFRERLDRFEQSHQLYFHDKHWRDCIWKKFHLRVFAKYKGLKDFLSSSTSISLSFEEAKLLYQKKQHSIVQALAEKVKGEVFSRFYRDLNQMEEQRLQQSLKWEKYQKWMDCKLIYEHIDPITKEKQIYEFLVNKLNGSQHCHGVFDFSKPEDDEILSLFSIQMGFLDRIAEPKKQIKIEVFIIPKMEMENFYLLSKTFPFDDLVQRLEKDFPDGGDVIIVFIEHGLNQSKNNCKRYRYRASETLESLSSHNLYDIFKKSTTVVQLEPKLAYLDAMKKAETNAAICFLGPCIITAAAIHWTVGCCSKCSKCCISDALFKDLLSGCCNCLCCGWNASDCCVNCLVCQIDALAGYIPSEDCHESFRAAFENAIRCIRRDHSHSFFPIEPPFPYWIFPCCGYVVFPCWLCTFCVHSFTRNCCLPIYLPREEKLAKKNEAQVHPEIDKTVFELSRFSFQHGSVTTEPTKSTSSITAKLKDNRSFP